MTKENQDASKKVEKEFETPQAEGLEFPSRKKLEDQLTALEKERDEFKNEWMRAKADLENVRRRAERDITNAHKFGVDKLLSDLLPVMDSMTRALEGPESQDPHARAMREGMKMTLEIFEKTLQKFGVEPIAPKAGENFDPERHEAISMISDPDGKANTIHEVIQRGYQLNGRVLRAAMVVVVSR